MKFRCPECGSIDEFMVDVTAKCRYKNSYETYSHFVEIEPQEDDVSETVQCLECGHGGTYAEFNYTKPEIDNTLLDEFKEVWSDCKEHLYKPGTVFNAFGVKYKVCKGSDCDKCAFYTEKCDLNPAIPSCNNNIHFEIIKEN